MDFKKELMDFKKELSTTHPITNSELYKFLKLTKRKKN